MTNLMYHYRILSFPLLFSKSFFFLCIHVYFYFYYECLRELPQSNWSIQITGGGISIFFSRDGCFFQPLDGVKC
jgi:hypothetical protein